MRADRRPSLISKLTHGKFGEGKHRAILAHHLVRHDARVPSSAAQKELNEMLAQLDVDRSVSEAELTVTATVTTPPRRSRRPTRAPISAMQSFERHAWQQQKQQSDLKQRSHDKMAKKMARRKAQRADLLARFNALDVDGDGVLSIAELRSILPPTALKAEIDELVASLDENGDGEIDVSEFKSIVKNLGTFHDEVQRIMTHFKRADVDGDGQIAPSELLPLLPSDFGLTDAELMVHQFDRDHSGTLGLHDLRLMLEASGSGKDGAQGDGTVVLSGAWAHRWRDEARRVNGMLKSFRSRHSDGDGDCGLEVPLRRNLLPMLLREEVVGGDAVRGGDLGVEQLCAHCRDAALHANGPDSDAAKFVSSAGIFLIIIIIYIAGHMTEYSINIMIY